LRLQLLRGLDPLNELKDELLNRFGIGHIVKFDAPDRLRGRRIEGQRAKAKGVSPE